MAPVKPATPRASSGQTAGKLFLLLVLLGSGWWLYARLLNPDTPGAERQSLPDVMGAAVRKPQVVVDEELAVGADGWQSRGFVLPSARPLQVVAEGMKDADKGFKVYVIESKELDNLKAGRPFMHLTSFEGLTIRSFKHTEVLPPGSWTVVVHNSENIFNTMIVHLRVVVDPNET